LNGYFQQVSKTKRIILRSELVISQLNHLSHLIAHDLIGWRHLGDKIIWAKEFWATPTRLLDDKTGH